MTTEPKLLTEAEAIDLQYMTFDERMQFLRERGLIAEESVDPLLVEAREICAQNSEPNLAGMFHAGDFDNQPIVCAALAALRRGMGLQREKLTVEVVDEALVSTFGDIWQAQAENVHAALTEALQ